MLQIIQYAFLAASIGLIVLTAVGSQITAFLALDELRDMGIQLDEEKGRDHYD